MYVSQCVAILLTVACIVSDSRFNKTEGGHNRLKAPAPRPKKGAVKGVSQARLILVKKSSLHKCTFHLHCPWCKATILQRLSILLETLSRICDAKIRCVVLIFRFDGILV